MGYENTTKSEMGVTVQGRESTSPKPGTDPEVSDKPVRRQFTREYKLRILRDADRCANTGEIGSLLRREGLYSSNLSAWRAQRNRGELDGRGAKKRGKRPRSEEQMRAEIKQVRRQNEQLKEKLRKAETVIEVQKKVSELLGTSLPNPNEDGNC